MTTPQAGIFALHLQVYEQCREERLRKARDWFFQNYWPETFEESMRIAAPGTEGGNNFMMVVSYWEQARPARL